MKIVFVHNGKGLDNFLIKEYDFNPGIGGTIFVITQLINKLKKFNLNLEISLASDRKIRFADNSKIGLIKSEEVINNSIIICPISEINYLKRFKHNNCRLIFWSHHPHNSFIESGFNIRKFELVSLGEYQYLSNKKITENHYLIKNPFPEPINQDNLNRFNKNRPQNFVYLGALVSAKGLHLVLKKWPIFRKEFKDSKLNIIGGDIYRENSISTKIHKENKYENKLKAIINKMSKEDQKSITFLGLLSQEDKDQVLRNSDIAILNPTGKSEAAPASPLECYCYGIPVIAGGDYGAYDNMLLFPELDFKKQPIKKIIKNIANVKIYKELKLRSHQYAEKQYLTNTNIYQNWIDLFNKKLDLPRIKLNKKITFLIYLRNFIYNFLKYKIKKILVR